MITFVKLVCPNCGANLEVDSKLSQCFCQYCGAKILLHNENEHTININQTSRIVDEAELAKQENERKKIEMQGKERENSGSDFGKMAVGSALFFSGLAVLLAAPSCLRIRIPSLTLCALLCFITYAVELFSGLVVLGLKKTKSLVPLFVFIAALFATIILLAYLMPYAD